MSKILINTYNSNFTKVVDSNGELMKYQRFVGKYVDKNNEVLFDIAPNHRLYFGDSEREVIFKMINVTEKEVNNVVKKIEDIDERWTIAAPYNIVTTLFIRELVKKKKPKVSESAIMFLTLSLYSSLHYKYFKYLPNENCMEYTVNNMTNKFLIKKYGILYKALEHIALKNHETYEKDLLRGDDLDIKNYIMNLRTRLNNFLKAIADAYMKNKENGRYLNKEEDSNEEESFYQTESLSTTTEEIIQKCSNRFFTNHINETFTRSSAKYCKVHNITLINALESIKDTETDKVVDLIRHIMVIYLSNPANSIESLRTNKFVAYCLQIYSKSNIKDQNINDMKKLLDYFLKEHCNRYSDTEREATRVSYRKALYVYFVLFINKVIMT